jgi:predicted porin
MKKVLFAIAATGFAAGAHAQSNVTIYGSLDAGVAYINNVSGGSMMRVDQGTMQPDRIGFRGTEDLGDGLKAIYQLEAGFSTDTGNQTNTGRLFNRASFVGLTGNFGTVTLGNQPDIVFDYVGKTSNGYQLTNFYLFHPGNLDQLANTSQFQNSVRYATPSFGGLTFSAMMGFGEVANDSSNGRNVGAGATYVQGPLRVSLAYNKLNDRAAGYAGTFLSSLSLGSATTVFDSMTTTAAGATYAFGAFRVNADYTQTKLEFAGISPTQKNVDLGTAWRYSPANTINVGFSNSRMAGARYNQYSLSHVHSFSKRTEFYAQAAYQQAGGAAKYAIQPTTGISGGSTQLVTTVGIHHMF